MKAGQTVLLRLMLAAMLPFLAPLSAQEAPAVTSHQKAARDLYRMVGGANTAEADADAMLSAMTGSNPQLAEYNDVIKKWYQKVFASGTFEMEIGNLYAQFFTEQEIKELMVFYKTPLGQKTLKTLPEIMKQGAMIGAKHAEANIEELRAMLTEAMKTRHPERFQDKNP